MKDSLSKSFTRLVDKLISRKLVVFSVASQMTYAGLLQGSEWLMVAMLYMGAEASLSAVRMRNEVKPTPVPEKSDPANQLM